MAHQAGQSLVMRKAFDDTLSVLGEMGRTVILSELKSMSLYSSQRDYLESDAIAECLERYFGAECTEMIMREVKLRMNELKVGSSPE
jgi:hypothetical protein